MAQHMAQQNAEGSRDLSTLVDASIELQHLVQTIWRLRQPDGCPWDREQTHRSIGKNMIEEAYEALDCIDKGMRMTAKVGTAKNYLANYPIEVACKTGTAQWQGVTSDGSVSGSDNASFVIYAPADDPEIAIAVYVEKGAQGGNLANVCIPIMDAYFSGETKYETILTENTVH